MADYHVWCTNFGDYPIPPEIYYEIVWEPRLLTGRLDCLIGRKPEVALEPAPLPANRAFWDWVERMDRESLDG